MLKKIISLLVIFAMLAPLSYAVAADEPTSQLTIEEILDGYHKKAFEAQAAKENGGISTYARSGSSQTQEQETVAELNAAGYEAYNVTGDNYETLEETLHTDFAEMGLDSNSSYIIVIGGEDPAAQSNPNARVIDPPTQEDFAKMMEVAVATTLHTRKTELHTLCVMLLLLQLMPTVICTKRPLVCCQMLIMSTKSVVYLLNIHWI